jgi:hypothetical protein
MKTSPVLTSFSLLDQSSKVPVTYTSEAGCSLISKHISRVPPGRMGVELKLSVEGYWRGDCGTVCYYDLHRAMCKREMSRRPRFRCATEGG